jgi:thymidylate synthase ThyX
VSLRGETAFMGFSARILQDSISAQGARLTSMEVRYPRFIHSEMMTHRVFSRNAASSRAIPIAKMIAAVRDEPAMPIHWGVNQTGMSARENVTPEVEALARAQWGEALADALRHAERLSSKEINLHKQLVNRLLEPFAWITVIITATEWANFFTQRCHPDAQPEIHHIANLMLAAYRASTPEPIAPGRWHLPLIQADERDLPDEMLCKISVARCARVSYLTHDGKRDHEKDLELYERLLGGGANGHWSPFEHVATPSARVDERSGNFIGWEQFRKRFTQEHSATFPDVIADPIA